MYGKKPLQYCKVISLQLIKINEKKNLVRVLYQGKNGYSLVHPWQQYNLKAESRGGFGIRAALVLSEAKDWRTLRGESKERQAHILRRPPWVQPFHEFPSPGENCTFFFFFF